MLSGSFPPNPSKQRKWHQLCRDNFLSEQAACSIPGPVSPCSSSVYHTRCRNVVWGGICSNWRRKWQPTPVCLPRKFHGQRILVGCSPWDCKESDTTERLTQHIMHQFASLSFLLLIKYWRRQTLTTTLIPELNWIHFTVPISHSTFTSFGKYYLFGLVVTASNNIFLWFGKLFC